MKKELSPGLIIGAIVGLVVVIGAIVLAMMRSDPAAQAPNPPPRFDPGAKAAESHKGPPGRGPGDPHPR